MVRHDQAGRMEIANPRRDGTLADLGQRATRPDVPRRDAGPDDVIAQKREEVAMSSRLVRLRMIERDDLPRLYQMQLDPESNRMAVTIPRSAEAFETHWADALRDPNVTAKAILLDEEMVGHVSCFPHEGRANVGYWIRREMWGQGIASRALELLLLAVNTRPLYARVATSNGASVRVLQKCRFVVERIYVSPASDRYPECEEAILVLNEDAFDGTEKTREVGDDPAPP